MNTTGAEQVAFAGTRPRARRAFYDFMRTARLATRSDIAENLGLSAPTVSKYLSAFLSADLLEERVKLASGTYGGRNPIAYACVPDARIAVGVDITKERVRTVVVDLECTVLASQRTQREFSRSSDYMEFLGAQVAETVRQSGVSPHNVLGVGIAIPGLIDKHTGEVVYGRVIDVSGMAIEDFTSHTPYSARLVHDSAAAGLAEFWNGEDLKNAFYISLGASVGGSILIEGKIFEGDRDVAGEIGHMHVQPEGLQCYCGRHGCLDPYVNSSVLSSQADGGLDGFFAELSLGNPVITETWESYTSTLARAVHNIRVLFGCSIILGGEVGPYMGEQLSMLRAKVDDLSFRPDPAQDFLLPCDYRTHSVATGAALFLIDDFRQDPGSTSRITSRGDAHAGHGTQ